MFAQAVSAFGTTVTEILNSEEATDDDMDEEIIEILASNASGSLASIQANRTRVFNPTITTMNILASSEPSAVPGTSYGLSTAASTLYNHPSSTRSGMVHPGSTFPTYHRGPNDTTINTLIDILVPSFSTTMDHVGRWSSALPTTLSTTAWNALMTNATASSSSSSFVTMQQQPSPSLPPGSSLVPGSTLMCTHVLPTVFVNRPPPQMIGIFLSIVYQYILPAICIIGIIGNIMNLVTLASRRLRAVSYMYLRALAVADLFCMIFVFTFTMLERFRDKIHHSYWFGFYAAYLNLSCINWALGTGVFIVVALSLERYISIIHPMSFRAWNSPKRALTAIALAYIIPLILYVPYAYGRHTVACRIQPNGDITYTNIDSPTSKTPLWQAYEFTRELTLRFGPIILLAYLNGRIMCAFRRRQTMFSRLKNRETSTGTTAGAATSSSARDDTLLYILGGIAVMFFICNLPAAINLIFINEVVKNRADYQIFRAIANVLEITNHAAQFYIFCACSTDYRATFLLKFPCFKAYYTNRDRFKSLMKRPRGDTTGERSGIVNGMSVANLENQHLTRQTTGSGNGGGRKSRSTVTGDAASSSGGGGGGGGYTTITIRSNDFDGNKNALISTSATTTNTNMSSNGGIEIGSGRYTARPSEPQHQQREQDTVEVQLASGEEDNLDSIEESESLLVAQLQLDSGNDTTYL